MGKTTVQDLDQEMGALRLRNEQRAAEVIARMGKKYVCHPVNVVRRDPMRGKFVPAAAVAAPLVLLRKGGVQ